MRRWKLGLLAVCWAVGSMAGNCFAASPDRVDLKECYGDTIEYELEGQVYGDPVKVRLSVPIDDNSHPFTILNPSEQSFLSSCFAEPVRRTRLSVINGQEQSENLFSLHQKEAVIWVQLIRLGPGKFEKLDFHYETSIHSIEYHLMTGMKRPHTERGNMIRIGRSDSLYGIYISGPDWSRPNGNPMTFNCVPAIKLDASCTTSYSLESGLTLGYRVLLSGSRIADLRELDAKIRAYVQELTSAGERK